MVMFQMSKAHTSDYTDKQAICQSGLFWNGVGGIRLHNITPGAEQAWPQRLNLVMISLLPHRDGDEGNSEG